jgi:tetratricopeptide (TPR) repeat protein
MTNEICLSRGTALYLMNYLSERQEPLSREELKNFASFHRTHGTAKILKGVINEWVRRFPEDREALWVLVQAQNTDGQLESALTTLTPILNHEPDNTDYLAMAADLEFSLYQSQRSYLNPVSNKRTLALLECLLKVDGDHKAKTYRKIPQVYAVDRNYATSLRSLEQAAEYSAQGEKHGVAADALGVEAAQTALEMEELDKAHGYLLKALGHNPQNPSARQLLRKLPILGISPL